MLRVDRFLEHQIVALEAEWIVRQFERDVVVAAERELGHGLELPRRQPRRELDGAGRDHVGRGGDDGGAGDDRALRRFHLDAAPQIDRCRRRRQFDRDTLGKAGEQRAETLPAEGIDVAFGGFREIHGRDFRKLLAAAERAEHELDCRPPVAEVARQRLPAGDVTLARSLDDRAIGAHAHGQEILELALPGVASADAHLLACRRRIDIKPPARRRLGHWVEVGHMDPVGAAVIGHAESGHIGDAAAAGVIGRFDHHDLPLGCRNPPRRGNPGGARADDDDIRLAAKRCGAGGGPRRKRSRGGKERAAAQSRHGLGMPALAQIARTAGEAQTWRRACEHLCRFAGVFTSAHQPCSTMPSKH